MASMLEPDRTIYTFDGFQLDARKRLLMRDGHAVQLSSKAFDLLLTLVESGGREISKEELMERVWTDQIVEDANLTVTMSHLRKALGEKANEHRFIVTIPGRGYRFVGESQVAEGLIVEQHTVSQIVIEQDERDNDTIAIPARASLPESSSNLMRTRMSALPARDAHLLSSRKLIASAAVIALLAITIGAYYFWTKRGTPTGAPQIKSIAVLPFKPLVAESRDEALELGMADTLIARLSNIREINVLPISSVRKYGALEQDPIAAGREQRVDAVLDGQIQKAGEKIRVTVRLLRVADGMPMWASQFDEKMTDIFAVQDSISERVTAALAVRLTNEEQRRLVKRDTTSAEAYQFYLRGRYLQDKRTADGLRKSIQEFQQAIDRDPNYALGYVGLADSYWSFEQVAGVPTSETLPKATAAADRALQIDDSLSEAHASSARIYQQLWRWSEAEAEYKRAISLNPNNPTAHQRFALYLRTRLRFDEAMSEIKRAQELDPVSPGISANAAFAYLLKNDLNAAIEQDKKIIELDPGFWIAHNDMGWAYLKQRRYEEATAEFQKAVDSSGRASLTLGNLGHCYGVTGRRTEALALAKELEERYAKREAIGFFIATVYAGLGDKDQAFAWLEKDFQQRSGQLPFITWWPNFESLRSDPRYADLLRRMRLPQ
jgi:DNA-binding winged helix-turn-helix (wHTH) protein/TolB-like protein/tetratricopeptide (TPR) repeat protein